MQLSKSFVGLMGVVMLVLLVSLATEEGRCIARARRLIQEDMNSPNPVLLTQKTCEPGGQGSRAVDRPQPLVPQPSRPEPAAPTDPASVGGSRSIG